jgi:hypothetical protein
VVSNTLAMQLRRLLVATLTLFLPSALFAQTGPVDRLEILGRLAIGESPSYVAHLVKVVPCRAGCWLACLPTRLRAAERFEREGTFAQELAVQKKYSSTSDRRSLRRLALRERSSNTPDHETPNPGTKTTCANNAPAASAAVEG